MLLVSLLALAGTPDPPESCYDSVYVDLAGIGDAPTCWFVDGNGVYTSPDVTAGDITIQTLPDGTVRATCRAALPNDSGRAVLWDSANSCATDPDVRCEIGDGDGGTVGTEDWRIVVSASGNATLTCTYRP